MPGSAGWLASLRSSGYHWWWELPGMEEIKWMAYSKTLVTPVLNQRNYFSLTLSHQNYHQYFIVFNLVCWKAPSDRYWIIEIIWQNLRKYDKVIQIQWYITASYLNVAYQSNQATSNEKNSAWFQPRLNCKARVIERNDFFSNEWCIN